MKSPSVVVLLALLTIVAAQPAFAAQSSVNFAKAVAYDSGSSFTQSIAVADLNHDGKLDVVVANCGTSNCLNNGTVSVLLGNGDGTLRSPVTYSSGGSGASSIVVADLNGDGKLDLVVADLDFSLVGVLLGNGDGTFQPVVTYSSGAVFANSVAVADVNGDGKPDVIVANQAQFNGTNEGGVSVLLGNGDGTLQPAVVYDSGGIDARAVAIADVNRDGKPDLVVANACASSGNNCTGEVSVMLGNGDGTFQAASSYDTVSAYAWSVAVADLNGDSKLDLVVGNEESARLGTVSVLLGNGDGTFQPAVIYSTGGSFSRSVAIGDLNGDGRLDVVVSNQCQNLDGLCRRFAPGGVGVLLGNGDGTFKPYVRYGSGGNNAVSVTIGDLNGDGEPDLLLANECAASRNTNSCTTDGSVGVLLNKEATTTKVKSSLNPSRVNQSVTFTATITSITRIPDGETVTFYAGTTKLGTGTTANGVATFTTSFSIAGTYSIKAKYPGDALHLKSQGSVKQVVNP